MVPRESAETFVCGFSGINLQESNNGVVLLYNFTKIELCYRSFPLKQQFLQNGYGRLKIHGENIL